MKEYTYKVVGVTYPARDGSSRQETLKRLFTEDYRKESWEISHGVKFEGYEFEGSPALAVLIDGKEVGNIASDKVREVIEIARKAKTCVPVLGLNGKDVQELKDLRQEYQDGKRMSEEERYYYSYDDIAEEYEKFMDDLNDPLFEDIYSVVLKLQVEEPEDIEAREKRQNEIEEKKAREKEAEDLKARKAEEKAKRKAKTDKGAFLMLGILLVMLAGLTFLVAILEKSVVFGTIALISGAGAFGSFRQRKKLRAMLK